jgi:hypothetical protein
VCRLVILRERGCSGIRAPGESIQNRCGRGYRSAGFFGEVSAQRWANPTKAAVRITSSAAFSSRSVNRFTRYHTSYPAMGSRRVALASGNQ